ncbi:MAG: heme lyase CcmF/NrfE family subunit [Thermoflexales bacterium]|nr:heme lyase CcmF/NrfE family subunit [Thermoflexales bacterium]
MIPDIGLITLILSGVCALFALAASAGARASRPAERWAQAGRNAVVAVAPLLTLSALALVYANLSGDYSLEYTTQVSSRATPTVLKITALWGGQNGSLLFWVWLMSLFSAGVLLIKWDEDRELRLYVTGILAAVLLFFTGLVLVYANPFARWWQLPDGHISAAVLPPAGSLPFAAADGYGLAALLRHPGMIIHPPFLYLGFVGFVVPFAYAMAALLAGRSGDTWLRATRRWTLAAWLFLSLGLLLGARWAYDVLGWGGYWGWDPVENAALMPWLSATAFVHSAIIQEKRGMLKTWNVFLIILTFCQVILGTFITRTGVIASVHSFARSSIGAPFLAFTAITLLGSISLLLARLEDLRSDNKLDKLLSREAAFLLQNVLFVLLNFVVALGTYFPILSDLVANNKITVGPPYYYQTVGPLLVPLLLLMGIAPLVSWRSASLPALLRLLWPPALAALLLTAGIFVLDGKNGFALLGFGVLAFSGLITLAEYARGARARHTLSAESYPLALWHLLGRNRRRYGAYLVHTAVILMGMGIIGTHFYQVETQRTLAPGQSLVVGGHSLRFERLELLPSAETDKQVLAARLSLTSGGNPRIIRPFQELYDNGERITPPVLVSTLKEDLYVLLIGWESDGSSATLKVFVNPLINWLWIGSLVFVVGTLAAAWPGRGAVKAERRAWRAREAEG